MLAVLVTTRVCSTSNIGGALGGGGGGLQMLFANYIPEGLEGALHPGYKFLEVLEPVKHQFHVRN